MGYALNQDNEQKLKTRLLKEIESCLVSNHDFSTVSAASLILKAAKVLELDNSIRLNDLMTYRNWSSHAKIDRTPSGLAEIVEHINRKLAEIRKEHSLSDDEYFEGVYDKHYFWFELTTFLTSLQPLLWDLKLFSQHFNLNSPGLDDESWWYKFKVSFFKELVDVRVIVNISKCPIKSFCVIYASEEPPEKSKSSLAALDSFGHYILLQSIYENGETEEDLAVIFKR